MDDAPAVHLLSENYDRPTTIYPAGAQISVETAMTPEEQRKLPIHVPQGRPLVRTKHPLRPEWLDSIRRPLLIVARDSHQYDRFLVYWKFDRSECQHVLLVNDICGVSLATVLLVLPDSRNDTVSMIIDIDPLLWWEGRGGIAIDIPQSAMETPFGFSLEDNMAAATRVAIAQHRHLDGLNRR